MSKSSRQFDVQEVDDFLAAPKSVSDGLPHWAESHIPGRWTASWPIQDADGIFEEGNRLIFTGKRDDPTQLSVSLLFRNSRVQAVDLAPATVCKLNPPDAGDRFGLPSEICGSHFHEWRHNRHVALELGLGRLPYRCPTPKLLTRLPHALSAIAQAINLTLTAEQASFDVPSQGSLLMRGGSDDV
ncbi:hypothetical protein [Brevundimonas sp.]|jgi:hypothetical protein|uniref:hypothetical protein n=1 Tax=Brevundimonas sp. TaxID=1871086 RepID=UPI00391C72C4